MLRYDISVRTFPPDIFGDLPVQVTNPRTTKDRFAGAVSHAVGRPGSLGSLLHEGDMAVAGGTGDPGTGVQKIGAKP